MRGPRIIVAALTICAACLASYDGTTQIRGLGRAPETNDGVAAFGRIASVLQSPRCINCHPRGDRPTQGDDKHVHLMNVQRGPDGNGVPVMRCSACHQQHNNEMAGLPGAPGWHLAPKSMGWVGLSQGALCRTLLDRNKNGNRSIADLISHMSGGDALVSYAWNPGGQRTPPPLSVDELKTALAQWAAAGAPCPK